MDHVPTGFQLLLKNARKLSPNSQFVIRITRKLPKAAPVRSLFGVPVCAQLFIRVLLYGLYGSSVTLWIVGNRLLCP